MRIQAEISSFPHTNRLYISFLKYSELNIEQKSSNSQMELKKRHKFGFNAILYNHNDIPIKSYLFIKAGSSNAIQGPNLFINDCGRFETKGLTSLL